MSKGFLCEQDASVPFDANSVDRGDISGRLYVFGPTREDGTAAWRFLTAAEETSYNADHDHARADDDGMGAAVGAAPASLFENFPDDYANEDDLGEKWGSSFGSDSAPSTNPEVQAIKDVMAAQDHAVWSQGVGVQPAIETERALADQAIAFINQSVGNLDKLRYTVVVYHMDGEEHIDNYSLVSTIERSALSQVALQEAMNAFNEGTEAVAGNTSLEV